MPLNNLIQFRKGEGSTWESINPVLASGEPGWDTTNNILKVGNGIDPWNDLEWFADIDEITGGLQGTQGIQGITGSQGVIGIQGNAGIQGDIGAQGSIGSQGIIGTQGITGSQGIQGGQGTTGNQGLTGSQGTGGIQGSTGSRGVAGSQGITGSHRIHAYLMEMISCFWFANQPFVYLPNTERKENWYTKNNIENRIKKWSKY